MRFSQDGKSPETEENGHKATVDSSKPTDVTDTTNILIKVICAWLEFGHLHSLISYTVPVHHQSLHLLVLCTAYLTLDQRDFLMFDAGVVLMWRTMWVKWKITVYKVQLGIEHNL